MIDDPRGVAERWPDSRLRALATVATIVTETPWALRPAHAAGLSDDELLHAIALSAYFGHLNRIADATAVPLDYRVRREPAHAEPATPALSPAPAPLARSSRRSLDARPATAAALTAWSDHVLERDAPLPRGVRSAIATHVRALLGAGRPGHASFAERPVLELASTLTLAPWRLGASAFAPLRPALDDAMLFDVCVVASTVGVEARIEVALAALDA
ncbi:MAG TPA: hypothetical protein VFQ53_10230 [Kofleriaceae bacterium]|nr:hypothetical protein [Kofleriaceae bacterium]